MIKFLKLLYCGIFGHKLCLLRVYPEVECERIYCERCKGEWSRNKMLEKMTGDSCVVKWSYDVAKMHTDMETAEEIINQYNKEQLSKKEKK